MAVSCGFDRDQLILYIVQLHQPGMHRAVFEVYGYRLQDVLTKLFPGLCFGEDAVAKSPRAIATFLGVANFEDQLHANRIPEAGMDWHLGAGPPRNLFPNGQYK